MRTSYLLSFAGAILLGGVTLATEPRWHDLPDPCGRPHTYTDIVDIPESDYNHTVTTTSNGELCCRLCWESMLDCAGAGYYEFKDEDNCKLVINYEYYEYSSPSDKCPLGVSKQGNVKATAEDWHGYILGPCYDPPHNW